MTDNTPVRSTDDLKNASGRVAVFTETGEERPVTGYCSICKADPGEWPNLIVSPTGMCHHSDGYEVTSCGKDATGWWWPE